MGEARDIYKIYFYKCTVYVYFVVLVVLNTFQSHEWDEKSIGIVDLPALRQMDNTGACASILNNNFNQHSFFFFF